MFTSGIGGRNSSINLGKWLNLETYIRILNGKREGEEKLLSLGKINGFLRKQ